MDNFFEPALAKSLTFSILLLNQPVGVEQETIARCDCHLTDRIVTVTVRQHSEEQAVAFDVFQLALVPTQERWMSRGGVQGLTILRIEPQIGRRDELTAQLFGKNATEPTQHRCRIIRAGDD